jgi:hypothetical protein
LREDRTGYEWRAAQVPEIVGDIIADDQRATEIIVHLHRFLTKSGGLRESVSLDALIEDTSR